MVRGLSKHQSAFLFDCCVFIARFASLSCYSSAKTRIRPVKSYHELHERLATTLASHIQNTLLISQQPWIHLISPTQKSPGTGSCQSSGIRAVEICVQGVYVESSRIHQLPLWSIQPGYGPVYGGIKGAAEVS